MGKIKPEQQPLNAPPSRGSLGRSKVQLNPLKNVTTKMSSYEDGNETGVLSNSPSDNESR
jgi:hypothetical protein